jgi:hypothetical protein
MLAGGLLEKLSIFMKEQDQNQSQHIEVRKDGTWEAVYCPFYVDDLTTSVIKVKSGYDDNHEVQLGFNRDLRKLREVKTLAYEGKIVKVQCHFFDSEKCKSDLNTDTSKACHLI